MSKKKYQLPVFLDGVIDQASYTKWLYRKSQSHIRRDRKRGNTTATGEEYKMAIHKAVIDCGGRDAYTHEKLDWHLVSTYDNKTSNECGREYKRHFALLPSVDHAGDGTGATDFKICSWRTNDSKSDMSLKEYIELCGKIIEFNHRN
jgi:hypothetical protein